MYVLKLAVLLRVCIQIGIGTYAHMYAYVWGISMRTVISYFTYVHVRIFCLYFEETLVDDLRASSSSAAICLSCYLAAMHVCT